MHGTYFEISPSQTQASTRVAGTISVLQNLLIRTRFIYVPRRTQLRVPEGMVTRLEAARFALFLTLSQESALLTSPIIPYAWP